MNTEVLAQNQFMLFDKVWGEPSGGLCYTDQLPNGDFIMFGGFRTQLTANQNYMCRTDSTGVILWEKDFGFQFDHDHIHRVIKTSWDTYLLIGNSEGDTLPGFREYAVWNIDADGNVIFERYFSSGYENFPSDVVETSDSCFTIAGVMDSPSVWNWALSILKIDRFGNEIWRNRIDSCSNYVPSSIAQLTDGSYIVVGWTYVSHIPFMAKYYPNGQLNWMKYPYGNAVPNSLVYPNKVFAVHDTMFSVFFGVNYTDSNNNQIWTARKDFSSDGLCISTHDYSVRIIDFLNDAQGSIVLGTSNYNTIFVMNADSSFTQVARLSEADSLACKSILCASPTMDGGYLGVGTADCGIYTRYYLVKFGPDGRYEAEDFGSSVATYPNPSFGGTVTLSFDMTTDQEVNVNIFSLDGKVVYSSAIQVPANTHTELPIDLAAESITSGTYVVEARTADTVYRNKMVVLTNR